MRCSEYTKLSEVETTRESYFPFIGISLAGPGYYFLNVSLVKMQNGGAKNPQARFFADLTADDQTFDIIKNLQEELAMERRSVRRLEEQLLKSQQRWNFFFAQYERMIKSQLDPIFDNVDSIFGKLIGEENNS